MVRVFWKWIKQLNPFTHHHMMVEPFCQSTLISRGRNIASSLALHVSNMWEVGRLTTKRRHTSHRYSTQHLEVSFSCILKIGIPHLIEKFPPFWLVRCWRNIDHQLFNSIEFQYSSKSFCRNTGKNRKNIQHTSYSSEDPHILCKDSKQTIRSTVSGRLVSSTIISRALLL